MGLCEYIQHISIFDYISVSASLDNRSVQCISPLSVYSVVLCVFMCSCPTPQNITWYHLPDTVSCKTSSRRAKSKHHFALDLTL